jgi:hypothetical protein
MMVMTHMAILKPGLQAFSHHRLGFVEDAQGFVFLSGFVVALYYGGLFQNASFDSMRASLFFRVRQLYVYNLVCLSIVFALAFSDFEFAAQIKEMARIGEKCWQDVLISLFLINGPKYVDILPMYICFMLFVPLVLHALWRGGTVIVIVCSFGLYLLSQSGIFILLANEITAALNLTSDGGFDANLYFYRTSWQLLFVAGLVGGALFAQGMIDLSCLSEPKFERLFRLSLFGVLFFALLRYFEWVFNGSEILRIGLDRSNLGILRLANFAADAYAIVYLAVIGPTSSRRWVTTTSRVLRAIFTWQPFVFLGRYSLQVYTLHVVLVYLVAVAVFQFDLPVGKGWGDMVLIFCWAMLFIPGLWRLWRVAQKDRSTFRT